MSEPDWHAIAAALAEALQSFVAFDGGWPPGSADEGNRGDWKKAEAALAQYAKAVVP
jgi:hypothetical protein